MKRTIIGIAFALSGCEAGVNDGAGGAGASGSTGQETATVSGATQSTGATMSAQQPFTSGTRLRVRKVTGDDGSVQQLGFFDSTLNVACAFGVASDGSWRCLPTTYTSVSTTLYDDAGCTKTVAVATCSGEALYAREPVGTACNGAATFYAVTGIHTGPVYQQVGATCMQATLPGFTFHDVGAVVDVGTFAKGAESIE